MSGDSQSVPHCCSARSSTNCQVTTSAPESSTFQTIIKIIEKVSAVALAAFSLYTNWQLFIPFFFAGVALGIYSYLSDKKSAENKSCHNSPVSTCSQGFMEQLTGIKLHPVVSLAGNIAVTVCHIDHHDTVFVPIVGFSVGAWLGKLASEAVSLLFRNITDQTKAHTHA